VEREQAAAAADNAWQSTMLGSTDGKETRALSKRERSVEHTTARGQAKSDARKNRLLI